MLSVLFNKDRSKPFVRDRHTYSYNKFTDRHRDRDRDRFARQKTVFFKTDTDSDLCSRHTGDKIQES